MALNPTILSIVTIAVAVIDFFVYIVTLGWLGLIKKLLIPSPRLCTVSKTKDDPSHRVSARCENKELVVTPPNGSSTLYEYTKKSFEKYKDRRCFAEREYLGWKVPGEVREYGDVKWYSFSQIQETSYKFGAALRAAGMQPAPETTILDQVNTPCRFAIYENTCPSWSMAAIGAFSQSITVTCVQSVLGKEIVVDAVNDNLASVIMCNKRDVGKIVSQLKSMPTLRTIVFGMDLVAPDEDIQIPEAPPGVKIISFDDFVSSGDVNKYPPTPPKPETCALVMYTSGSTGKPKGVLLTHRSMMGSIASYERFFPIEAGKDIYLAYLPVALMEILAEVTMMSFGCTSVFTEPKSMSSTFAYPKGALQEYQPTVMITRPKMWDLIAKKVQDVTTESYFLSAAIRWRMWCQRNGFDVSILLRRFVFAKFNTKVFGGKLRMSISASAPLNEKVHHFCRAALGVSLGQGYGMTESCSALALQEVRDLRGGIAGCPLPSVEVKLVSTPEVSDKNGLPYLSTDRRDVDGKPVLGRGEVTIRGANVAAGYYMMPELTEEVFSSDGWFHTGDVGQFTPDGCLRIVDRIKNLVKLKEGIYIALEQMDIVYGNSPFVDTEAGGICCYGDGDMDRPVALVQLSEEAAMDWWSKEKGSTEDLEAIANSSDFHDAVLANMHLLHSKSDLGELEKLAAVSFIVSSPWTPENNCLTSSYKLQRRIIYNQCEHQLEKVRVKGIFQQLRT